MENTSTENRTRKRGSLPLLSMDLAGRIPPHAKDLEEAVLGAMMLEHERISSVIDILTDRHFYFPEHQFIFRAIYALYQQNQPVDLLTVNNHLRNANELELAGGSITLANITNKVSSGANIEFHSRLLTQKFIQRELIRVSGEITAEAYNDSADAFEMLDDSEKKLYEIKNTSLKRSFTDIGALMNEAMKELENRKEGDNNGITGVASGLSTLDAYTAGWQKSDLIILAARPAMGKTAFALSLARNAAVDFGKKVMVFSLEMADIQLVNRLISGEAEIASDKIRKADLSEEEWERLHNKTARLSESHIYIDDTPQLSVLDLNAKCRRLHSQQGLDLVVVDYLQLLRHEDKGAKGNREQEIAFISRSLKALAKELNIPVIALAQLSRQVETRQVKIPQLSDLRESGSIEQDADMVLFLYRDEYYNKTGAGPESNSEYNTETYGIDGLTQVILAKNRHGAVGKAYAKFIGQFSKFVDLEMEEKMQIEELRNSYNSTSDFTTTVTKSSKMNEPMEGNFQDPFIANNQSNWSSWQDTDAEITGDF